MAAPENGVIRSAGSHVQRYRQGFSSKNSIVFRRLNRALIKMKMLALDLHKIMVYCIKLGETYEIV
jgi:hypothetical protein